MDKTLRGRVTAFVETAFFRRFILGLILFNALILALMTDHQLMEGWGRVLVGLDDLIIGAFVVEIILRLYAYRLAFFRGGWNVFDFVIVAVSLVPASGPFAVVRTLRVLRLLRLISVVPRLRRVVEAILSAIPGMGAIIGLMMLFLFVASVMTTQVFGAHPAEIMQEYYGDMGNSLWTLFQVMTTEGWNDIANNTLAFFPYAWIFFVIFLVIMTFAVLNLFLGVIVDTMNTLHEEDSEGRVVKNHSEEMLLLGKVHDELTQLRQEVEQLKKQARD